MTQDKTLNVKLSNSENNQLKFVIKNGAEVTSKLSSKLLVILMMRIIFRKNCYKLVNKFQSFLKLLQIIPQLIKNFQKLNCIK